MARHDVRIFRNSPRGFEYPPADDEELLAEGFVPLSRAQAAEQQVEQLKAEREHLREECDKAISLWKQACVARDDALLDAKRGWDEVYALMQELGRAVSALRQPRDSSPVAVVDATGVGSVSADVNATGAGDSEPEGECAGLAAQWCPIHGECVCPADASGERTLDEPRCPLHAPGSTHGEPSPPPAVLPPKVSGAERAAYRVVWDKGYEAGWKDSDASQAHSFVATANPYAAAGEVPPAVLPGGDGPLIDAFCSAEHLWVQGKTHEALGRLCTAVARLADKLESGAKGKVGR